MPTDREIELYYFDIFETLQMVKFLSHSRLADILRSGQIEAVKFKRHWMIKPDQIPILKKMSQPMRKAA